MSYGVARSGKVLAQGEKTVGNATVQLTATSTPCAAVWVGAPTASHTKAGVNTARILVGIGTTGAVNKSGGRPLAVDNEDGILILIDDASRLWLTGTVAADAVEYQIYGDA